MPESAETNEPTMANQGLNTKDLSGLQSNEIAKITKKLQGLAVTRNNPATTKGSSYTRNTCPVPSRYNHPNAAVREEQDTILWEKVGAGQIRTTDTPAPTPARDKGSLPITAPLPLELSNVGYLRII